MRHIHGKTWLYSELVILMILLPAALYLVLPPRIILPTIWIGALYAHLIYRQLDHQPRAVYWNMAAVNRTNLLPILRRFALSAVVLTVLTVIFKPDMLFTFVREKFGFWIVVMVMYPLLSVIAQEIIFRSFFFARYRQLFKREWLLVLMSGLTFGLAHLVFHNWVAPALCVIGGVFFAQTYARHRSLMLVVIEHALYGDFLFTLGLGKYFYHGSIALAQGAVAH